MNHWPSHCARCGADLTKVSSIMSKFNQDTICADMCKTREKASPNFKAADEAEATRFLRLLSGRNHRVLTGVALARPGGGIAVRGVETRVSFKTLSEAEIAAYVATGDWRGKAGAYAIQGPAAAFVRRIVGSHPAVMGLPLYETMNLLVGAGWTPPAQS